MGTRLRSLLAAVPAFVFACLAFSFCVANITSRDWSRRNYYNASLDPLAWDVPLYSIYRSPFQICDVSSDTSANATIYTEHCNTFHAYGFDKTSCETVFATQNYSAANTGDERLCQQIHYAGNLVITSVTFISLGFVLTLLMTILAFVLASPAKAPEAAEESTNNQDEVAARYSHHHRHPGPSYTPHLNLILITSFCIGATAALISQFYGILGFIQSQPDNGAFAGAPGNPDTGDLNNNHGPWIQGKALKYWATLSWIFAAFAAGAAGAAWRLPRWEKNL